VCSTIPLSTFTRNIFRPSSEYFYLDDVGKIFFRNSDFSSRSRFTYPSTWYLNMYLFWNIKRIHIFVTFCTNFNFGYS
jgi:hypothetical protein